MDPILDAVLTELFRNHPYLSHVCFHPPEGEHNPDGRWLCAAISGGTPSRGWGGTPGLALADLVSTFTRF
jgi:hypothetical protein